MLKKLNQDLVSEKENLENVTTWKTECSCSEIYHIKQDLNQLTFPEQEPVKELSKTNTIPVADDAKKVKNGDFCSSLRRRKLWMCVGIEFFKDFHQNTM